MSSIFFMGTFLCFSIYLLQFKKLGEYFIGFEKLNVATFESTKKASVFPDQNYIYMQRRL